MDKKILKLYAITDHGLLRGRTLEEVVEEAILGGATLIQYRAKSIEYNIMKSEAENLLQLCQKYGINLIINDNVELAKEIGAAGVHLGASDMAISEARKILGKNAIIGATAKTARQAVSAWENGADYLGSGAVFGTTTKADAVFLPRERLKEIASCVDIPVVAIGGIDIDNVLKLKGCNIDGVAVVSGIFGAADIKMTARQFSEKLKEVIDDKYHSMATALTIAGSDSSGGAGIQADLKTMIANNVYGMSAITALTAQNTQGVDGISQVEPEFVGMQIDSVFNDIRPDAVKIGMLSSKEIIDVVVERLEKYNATNIVTDPVMVSTSGSRLIMEDAIEVMTAKLFPISKLVTPNILEAEILADMSIKNSQDMMTAAKTIYDKYGCAVLLKGGHQINTANDFLYDNNCEIWFESERIDNENTHGTGCTLSSAIASYLARGYELKEAVELAKKYISLSLKDMLDLGKSSGPLSHGITVDTKGAGLWLK